MSSFLVVIKRLLAALNPCRMCDGGKFVLYYGTAPFAELRVCSACGSGEKICDTQIPVASSIILPK